MIVPPGFKPCPKCLTDRQRTKWAMLRCCCPGCHDKRVIPVESEE